MHFCLRKFSFKLSALIALLPALASAEFMYLGRSPEALLMGDAYTAVADDENTLFYNPAALGRHSGVTVNFLNPTIEVTNYLEYKDKFSDFPKDPAGIADRAMGIPVYFRLGVTPGIKVQNFGFTLFANSKTSLHLENAIHPLLNVNYNYDRGFALGYALNLGTFGNKKSKSGGGTSIGVGVKRMTREAIEGKYPLFGVELIEAAANAEDFADIREGLGFSKGAGWGLDLGLEQNFYNGPSRVTFGASLMDVGNTRFEKSEGKVDVPVQKMGLNFGTAFSQDFKIFEYTLSADMHPMLESIDYASKLHLGARAGFPFLKFYMGWNGGYLSYGGSVDVLMFRLTAGFYGVETGHTFKQKEAERAFVSLNLLNFHWDI